MRLSKVMEIAEVFGYEFIITYTVPYASAHNTNLLIDRYAVNGVKSLAEKRMTFLRFAIAQANITASDVAAAVGLQRQDVQRWFRQGDVNVRYIYELAETMNRKVNIHFKRKEQAEAADCVDTEETTRCRGFYKHSFLHSFTLVFTWSIRTKMTFEIANLFKIR